MAELSSEHEKVYNESVQTVGGILKATAILRGANNYIHAGYEFDDKSKWLMKFENEVYVNSQTNQLEQKLKESEEENKKLKSQLEEFYTRLNIGR